MHINNPKPGYDTISFALTISHAIQHNQLNFRLPPVTYSVSLGYIISYLYYLSLFLSRVAPGVPHDVDDDDADEDVVVDDGLSDLLLTSLRV